jgi:hypothetical protein
VATGAVAQEDLAAALDIGGGEAVIRLGGQAQGGEQQRSYISSHGKQRIGKYVRRLAGNSGMRSGPLFESGHSYPSREQDFAFPREITA